jgi:hypothetical protein
MSDQSTKRMLAAYFEQSQQKPGFLTSFFQTPDRNFHDSETVEIDVKRTGHNIAIVIQDLSAGLHRSENALYTNKEFKPPIYGEEFALNVFTLLKRRPGYDPFQDVGFLKALREEFDSEMSEREGMIRRSIELQAAQVLQTGQLTLTNAAGTALYTLDYKPKATHLTTPTADWDENSGTNRLADVQALANVCWQDGNHMPKYLVFGDSAIKSFLDDSAVKEQFRKDGVPIGEQVPPQLRNGGVYHGTISVGQFKLEIWSYPGFYSSPLDGTPTKYLSAWKVLCLSENARLDLTFGNIPNVVGPDPRVAPLGLGRASNPGSKVDMITNAWVTPNGRTIMGSVEARPLCQPTAIDSFGCLNAKVT